ncbi:DUF4145 domain-containing protein [Neobacillus sp. BF23-41]|uniref:DUF4145 domain-containing protein n=1 Tax=Neobacillus sp. BF23-41 TaxID=3240280 RepID=UPI0034E46F9F
MKSIMFKVKKQDVECFQHSDAITYELHMKIPILAAYSVEYFSVHFNPVSGLFTPDCIKENELVIAVEYIPIEDIEVVLHYHGIRDYSLLFPWIQDAKLRKRVGLFYEEADKNFEKGAWLSFALMCGAVFEGMLFAKLNMPDYPNNSLNKMIIKASLNRILTQDEVDIMHKVRESRNLVHGNNFQKPFISRKDAMDIRSTLDQVIKKFAY